ncbi:MAG: sensor histidine kinase [Candidatus Woesearchaeota archaeon]
MKIFQKFKKLKEILPIEKKYYKFTLGLIFIGLSFITPKIFWNSQFRVLNNAYMSLEGCNVSKLIIAAIELVFLNTIRHLPIYIGVFIIADDFYHTFKNSSSSKFEQTESELHKENIVFIFPFIFIPIIYEFIAKFYNIAFVFSNVSVLAILILLIIYKIIEDIKFISIKILIVTLVIFAFDWVDIVPMFYPLGFGRGGLTITLHQVAKFIKGTKILNILGIIFASILLVNAFVVAKMASSYHKYLFLVEESKNKERKINRMQIEALKSRYYREIKNLVHDLKTPLTTIQGLSGVIKLANKESKTEEYAEKIITTTEKMDMIISEVLLEDRKYVIEVKELMQFVESQILCDDFYKNVNFEVETNIHIRANKYRLSRAIINLIDNALKASSQDNEVIVKGYKENSNVIINVIDKGEGIAPENLHKVWEPGYTSHQDNTGLGLNFVEDVVANHEGEIFIDSQPGKGTKVYIELLEVDVNEKHSGS